MLPTRRGLFRMVGAAALASKLPACGDNQRSAVFTNAEVDMLRAFADAILPPDDDPGGAELGAVPYIERLCRAFDELGPPAIFASGPFSGRTPLPDAGGAPTATFPRNDFAFFVELDRVSDAAARLRVLGSARLPGGAPNEALLGPVIGLADQLRAGLQAALAVNGDPAALSPEQGAKLFDAQPDEFKSLLIDLVSEAAFAAPEYGGNPGGAGWRLCHFEGDNLPLGYRGDAVSGPNPGADPAPLASDVTDVLEIAISVLGGRVRT